MSIKSFDDLLEQIKEDIVADKNAIRYCISPKEKLIITLRYVNFKFIYFLYKLVYFCLFIYLFISSYDSFYNVITKMM